MKRSNTKRTRSASLVLLVPHASVIAKRVEPADDEMRVFAWDARPNCDDPALLALAPDARIIVRQRGGSDVELSANRYITELAARRANQDKGIYTVWEAAELLNMTVDDSRQDWLEKLYRARLNGEPIVRESTETIKAPNDRRREHLDLIFSSDIDDWLHAQGLRRRFPELPACKDGPARRATAPEAATVEPQPLPGTGPERSLSAEPELPVKKAAMIARHKGKWPTIEGDMKDANRNGLNAARTGHRGWLEKKALEWAHNRNKLPGTEKAVDEIARRVNSMVDLPVQKHTMKG